MAVEVHQVNATSSDITFGCVVQGLSPFGPVITDPSQPTNRTVIQNRSTTLIVLSDGFPAPTYQWYFQDTNAGGFNPLAGATASSLVITQMAAANAGDYYAIVSGFSGSVTSRTARVNYLADTNPPIALRAFGNPTFTNIVVEFDELLDQQSAEDNFGYELSTNGMALDPNPILSATLNPNGSSVTLHTTPLAENTLYTLKISSVSDLALNLIAPDTTVQFRSWLTTGCGGVLFETYFGLGGSTVADLTNTANFPNNPNESYQLTNFDTRQVYPDDTHENYGGRLRGFFFQPFSGDWIFYSFADDGSELWFNPTGPSPAGRIRITQTTAANVQQTSAPQSLIGGQAYYIELLYKEAAGGDLGRVAARLQGAGVPPTTEFIPGSQLGYPAAPPGILGPVTILQQPVSQTVQANSPAVTFSVSATNALNAPICYQWQRSDSAGPFLDIAGATKSSYTLTFPTIADDNGDRYRVIVSVAGATTTSAVAALTVTNDTVRPRLACVLSTGPNSVVVYFTEPVSPLSVNLLNFSINGGILVDSVTQNANPVRVDLGTSLATPMTLGNSYVLTVTNVMDRDLNLINPNPSTASFTAQNFGGNPDSLKTISTNGCLPMGCLIDRGFNARIYQVSAVIANDNFTAERILAGQFINPATGQPYPNIAPVGARSFMETNIINYNAFQTNPASPSFGHIQPDVQFPGYPVAGTAGQSVENMTMEALAYVELRAGIHRWIVNSDDGFRVYSGLNSSGPIIGEFNGGRGSADTVFEFIVKQDCLYPFRLLWEQGQGGVNVEWIKQDLNTSAYTAINGDNTIRAFKIPDYTVAVRRLSPSGSVEIRWQCNGALQEANEVAGPWTDVPAATSPYVVAPTLARHFYRVRCNSCPGS